MATVLDARLQVMEGLPMPKLPRLFSDHLVTASELNRGPGAVLDKACRAPVTITRNDQSFALMRRDIAAHLAVITEQATKMNQVIYSILSVLMGHQLPQAHPYHWLHAFDKDDLVEMASELLAAFEQLEKGDSEDPEPVETVIYEWHQSAIHATNEVLREAFHAKPEPDAGPLPDPREILKG